jgi:hypothetical protein
MANLRIRIKQQQQFNSQQQQVHYAGNNPQDLKAFTSPLPANRQWRGYNGFIDVTPDVGDLQKLSLTWTQDRDVNGATTPGATNMKRSASGTLVFEGEAYELLKQWLIDDVSAPLNAVEVELHDTGCDVYFRNYTIRAKDLRYCEGSYCMFEANLQQKDEVLNCIKSTLITDNHQGWFPLDGKPTTGMQHPRFSYCNEIRPNASLLTTWTLGAMNFGLTNTLLIPISIALNGVFAVINVIIGVISAIINAIASLFGGSGVGPVNWQTIPYIDPEDIRATQTESFIESAGCGREHPAPLIRTYIENVCKKCSVQVDAGSAPIFFNPAQAVPFTSSGNMPVGNPHYNACYFYAPVKRGIRRANLRSPFRVPDFNNDEFWIADNSPLHTLDTFLDELKTIYNAEWRVVNNILYFQRKDYFQNDTPVYNFGKDAPDRDKLLEGICYEWNEQKYPSYTRGLYTTDDSDKCGNEARAFMNDMISHGNVDDNPNYQGKLDKEMQFGATRFRLDGITPDYIVDAAQAAEVAVTFLTTAMNLIKDVMDRISEVADYALLLNEETASLPKILLWDGQSYLNARCMRQYSASGLTPPYAAPPINHGGKYNSPAIPWWGRNAFNTYTRGSGGVLGSFPVGYYTVRNIFSGLLYQKPALLVNYHMYFKAGYEGTMWDLFHFIDDPEANPTMNQNWSLKMPLCCEDIEKLGVKNDAANIVLGQKLQLPAQYYDIGKIKEITLSYDPTHELGAYIELKGNN